jgi:class 3 adenylate cyclase/tetratricopeptide (TPR) repeat protein
LAQEDFAENGTAADAALEPYASRTALRWLEESPHTTHRTVDGSLVFADVSGFTPLTERLARRGKVGAEELTDVLNSVFGTLGQVTDAFDGDLLKFGGDALLLLFDGVDHVQRAAACAAGLLEALRPFKRLRTAGGIVSLSMSIGLETGPVHLLHVGEGHRELFALGPVVSTTVSMENAASGGQILVGPTACAVLDERLLGAAIEGGRLLVRPPRAMQLTTAFTPGQGPAHATMSAVLAEHLAGGREDGEHRVASLSFLQFKGTDRLLESDGLEAVAEALNHVISTAQGACERHGVTFLATDVDKDGGKVLFVAGAPRAGVHDEDRMLLALLDSVTANGVLVVRAGANRGRAFAVDVGSEHRRTYAVMGDATNLAARVMGKAEPGMVVATSALVEHVHGEFAMRELEPFMVKGKSMPISASVVGPPVGRDEVPTRTGAAELPFVGRAPERASLAAALDAARKGQGSVIAVVGEPGLGKSRLIAETLAAAADLRVVMIEGGRYAEATPYFALRAPLRKLIGARRDDAPELVTERLRQIVEQQLPDAVGWLPLLAPLVGVQLPDTPQVAALDPAFRRATIDAQAVRLLQTMRDPTLIVVEDAHWLDDASAAVLSTLTADIRDRPWFVCLSRRPVETGWVPDEGIASTLRLEPLTDADTAALLRGVATYRALTPQARAALAERGGGNPLFLRELIETVDVSGDIESLPDTLEGVIAGGIDVLDRADRDMLRVAAVLGGQAPAPVLAAMLDLSPAGLSAVLPRLGRFLAPDQRGMLRFSHALIRDVAYESLPFRRRRALHARAGEIIAGSAADPTVFSDLLALHFHAAERPAETWRHARIAGDRARHNSAPVEAARFYRWAVHAARMLPDLSPVERTAVSEQLGDVLELNGLYDDAATAFAEARRHAVDDPLHVAALLKKEGWVRERAGRYSAALSWYTRALKSIPQQPSSDEADRLRTQLVMSYGAARARQGRFAESLPHLLRAARDAERLGDRITLAHVYYLLDWSMTDMGHPDAERYRGLALPIYQELGDLVGEATVLNNLGIDAYYEGRWDESLALYERSREVCRRAGHVMMDVTALNNIGEILSDQGRLSEAREVFDEAAGICRSLRFPVGQALALSNLGRVASRFGRYDDAYELLAQARSGFVRIGADGFVVEVDARESERLLFSRDAAAALESATRTEVAARASGLPGALALTGRVAGLALAATDDLEAARARLEGARRDAAAAKLEYELALTLHAAAAVASLMGDADAEAMAISAASILDRLGVVDVDAVTTVRPFRVITLPDQRAAVD